MVQTSGKGGMFTWDCASLFRLAGGDAFRSRASSSAAAIVAAFLYGRDVNVLPGSSLSGDVF